MFGRKKTVTAPEPTATPVQPTKMVDLRKTAKVSLQKNGLNVDGQGGIAVYLVLDHSYSMDHHYASGDVQRITEQVLALSAEIDDDGKVPVIFFSSGKPVVKIVDIANCAGWVDKVHPTIPWGGTDYVSAMDAVAVYHRKNGGGQPGLVIFQTDGSPDSRAAAERKLTELAPQDLFFAFVGFGPKHQVQFLFELDTIQGRVRDNASAFHAADPKRVKDSDLYDGVLGEFTHDWLPEVLS
jgi:hypothetical protein